MTKPKLPVTGVLLVGGESRRMGENKAFLMVEGQTLIERSLRVLANVCQEVVISCRSPEQYENLGYPVVVDKVKGKGPLGGIYSVLTEAKHESIFVMACDMPFVDEDGIRILYELMEDYDAVIPSTGGKIHPLYAFYHKRMLNLVKQNLQDEILKITRTLDECRTRKVENINDFNLMNVNTPEDYQKILNKAYEYL